MKNMAETGLRLSKLPKRIVIHGEKEILDSVPSCKYGALQTVDRMEIESYRAIVNNEEICSGRDNRPLSLAVFMVFPGSGKSLGLNRLPELWEGL